MIPVCIGKMLSVIQYREDIVSTNVMRQRKIPDNG